MQPDWTVIIPEILLTAGGLAVFCLGAVWRRCPSGLLFAVAFAAATASAVLSAVLPAGPLGFAGMIDGSGYARFFTFLLCSITAIALLLSYHYAKSRNFGGDEFYALILFAALGMILVAGTLHWVIFFLGLELLSISLYVLIALPRNLPLTNEAGLKYFIMGAVASAILTFGIAILYAVTGKMNIAMSLSANIDTANEAGILLGWGLILVGMGFKVSLVPFHLWTPDVYQGAPAPVTAFLSTGSKVALFSALLRFALVTADGVWAALTPILWIMAVLTMVVGNITALTQVRLKRLLAYSSIAQMGYMLMALVAAKGDGAAAIMFYAAVYGLMDLGAFGTVALLSTGETDLDEIEGYRGLGYSHPWQAALLSVCLFSLAGLPPAAGFIGKFMLFESVLRANFIILAVIGILTAIVSVYFYLKVIVSLYMSPTESPAQGLPFNFAGDLAGSAVFLLILWLGIVPSSLLSVIRQVLTGP